MTSGTASGTGTANDITSVPPGGGAGVSLSGRETTGALSGEEPAGTISGRLPVSSVSDQESPAISGRES